MPEGANKVFHYVAPTISQARDIVWNPPDMVKKYVPREIIVKKNEVDRILYLINGAQIHIKGADNPDSLRGGNPFGVVLDECAMMKKEIYDEIYRPVLAANKGWIWFVSTPRGKNWFYKQYQFAKENPERWQVIHLKANESTVLSKETLDQAQAEMTQQAFSQEFLCEFLEGEGTIFRRIAENISGHLEEPKLTRKYKMGVDLARHKDWTVVTVIDRHTHQLVYFDRFNQIDWNLQKARIEATARRYNNAIVTVDATGVGEPVAEDLRRCGLIVNEFKFTNESKKNIIENLALFIEQNKMTYPNIPELIKELENFTYELLPSGQIRYTAPEGEHDDCVCSLALAMYQIGEKMPVTSEGKPNYGFSFNLKPQGGYNKMVLKR